MSDLSAEKAAVRAAARAARSAIAGPARIAGAEALAERLLALPELAGARVVLAYGAAPEEIDVAPAVAALRAQGVTIAYPRIDGPGELGVCPINDDIELVRGTFGLREPAAHAPACDVSPLDAVLVPGVAFDDEGRRLGFGGGYYDRLIPRLRPDCALIGVAFDEQIVPRVPAEAHDARVHKVVTPTRVLG